MRRFLFLSALLVFLSIDLSAQQATSPTTQTANCTQVLRLARAVYEQGRLHELELLLKDCLNGEVAAIGGFATVQEKVDAYRLLCLSFIYLEEPGKADEAMLGLLRTDHFFVINPTDPAEFQALHKTFRTEPVLSFGGKIGGNYNFASLLKHHPVGSDAQGQGTYQPRPSISFGGFIEKEFFANLREKNPLRNTLLRADIFYMSRAFIFTNDQLFLRPASSAAGFSAAKFEAKSASNWIDINVIIRYRYKGRKSTWDPYFGIGPGVSWLLSAKINQAKFEWQNLQVDGNKNGTGTAPGASYSGASIIVKEAYSLFPQTISAVWGVNRRFGSFYINIEGRFQYGIGGLINNKNRSIPEFLNDYGTTFNDFRQSNFIGTVGITVPKFIPKKLTKKK